MEHSYELFLLTPFPCDNPLTIFGRNQPNSAVILAMAGGCKGLSSFAYGVLLGCLGFGAIAGAWLLPRFRERVALNICAAAGTALFAMATIALA